MKVIVLFVRAAQTCESACVRARGRRALAGDAPEHASAPDSLSIAPYYVDRAFPKQAPCQDIIPTQSMNLIVFTV